MTLFTQISILRVETNIGTPQTADELQNNQLLLAGGGENTQTKITLLKHIIAQYSLANLPTVMQI